MSMIQSQLLNKTSQTVMDDYQVSVYDAINNSIHEYFIKKDYPKTLEVFQHETKDKLFGQPVQPAKQTKLDTLLLLHF